MGSKRRPRPTRINVRCLTLRWVSILPLHAYPQRLGYRERRSSLRHSQDTLKLPHLLASHRGLDNDYPFNACSYSTSSQPGKLTYYPALCQLPRLTMTIILCLGCPRFRLHAYTAPPRSTSSQHAVGTSHAEGASPPLPAYWGQVVDTRCTTVISATVRSRPRDMHRQHIS